MNRRQFLGRLFAGAGVAAAAPYVPFAKFLAWFRPKPTGPLVITWPMAHAIAAPSPELVARYIAPAAQAIADRIDAELVARIDLWPPLYGPGTRFPS